MQKTEVNDFIGSLRGRYNNFNPDSYIINEWYEELADYDTKDILERYEMHKRNGSDFAPSLNYLTKNLVRTKDKHKKINPIIYCDLCQKQMRYSEYERHRNKCLLIKSIIKLENKAGRYPSYEELDTCSYEYLRKLYDNMNPLDLDKLRRKAGI